MAITAIALRTAILVFSFAGTSMASAADWLQFGYDARHSGNNTAETAINAANVASLVQLYSVDVPLGAALVYLSDVSIGGVSKDLLFLNTELGELIAYDAATGSVVWARQTPQPSPPSGGVTASTPAIDPNRQFVYSYGLDGRVHKFAVSDGAETLTGGWPQTATLKPSVEHGASALTIATTPGGMKYLYVVNNGFNGDGGDYQGHLTTINLSSGSQRVFNVSCSDIPIHFLLDGQAGISDCATRKGGIWGRPGAVYDAQTNRVYVSTGNGLFDANLGGHNWGDSVLALAPDGTGSGLGLPIDSYTPSNYGNLDLYDIDLGSGALAIMSAPTGSAIAHIGVQMGKDGIARLLNLDNLSGRSSPGFVGGEVQLYGDPSIMDAPTPHSATWTDPADGTTWMFLPKVFNALSGIQLTLDGTGVPTLIYRWNSQVPSSATPVMANGVLYAPVSNGDLLALDPHTGNVLWSAPLAGGSRWGSPVVVEGRVFSAGSKLQAFGLDSIFTSGFEN